MAAFIMQFIVEVKYTFTPKYLRNGQNVIMQCFGHYASLKMPVYTLFVVAQILNLATYYVICFTTFFVMTTKFLVMRF